ncbi:MAG: universal stress protein UspA [Ruminiclostridium sp.]|nr:universal stress protein UspA [Ruminiclostridium sp.]
MKKITSINIKNILVCVTQQKTCERLIRKAAELRDEHKGNLWVIHVIKDSWNILDNSSEGEALEYLFGISKSAGANLSVLKSDEIVTTIAEYARENKIDCVILGDSQDDHKENNFSRQLKKLLSNVEVKIIP